MRLLILFFLLISCRKLVIELSMISKTSEMYFIIVWYYSFSYFCFVTVAASFIIPEF
jgi:hypothetical protein